MIDISGFGYWAGFSFGWAIFWWLVPLIVIFAIGLLIAWAQHWADDSVGGFFVVLAVILTPINFIVFMFVAPITAHEKLIEQTKVAQITEAGYEHVNFRSFDDQFTASRDGKYVMGVLAWVSENKYKIVEI